MKLTPNRLVLLVLAPLLVCSISVALYSFVASRVGSAQPAGHGLAYQPRSAGSGLPTLWRAPEFAFRDQTGQARGLADLEGHVWIADFVYTTCTSVCPLISAKRVLLQRRLRDPALRFVSFSVDPEHDTPEVLASYARVWNRSETRWLLLSTDPKGLAAAAAAMHIAVEPTGDDKDPILHSQMFFLVDRSGQVRGIYDSSDDEALRRLSADTRSLLGGSQPSRSDLDANANGKTLFGALGCAACHENAKLAPPLGGLVGRTVALEGGATVTANAAYIKESIVAPGSKQVAGYLNLMPSYASDLSPEQLDRLAAYVGGLAPSAAPQPATDVNPAVDPVCHMKVRATNDTPHVEHAGRTYYFCSESCRERFLGKPDKYRDP